MKNPLYNWSQIATFKLNSLHKLQKPGWKNLFLRNFFFKKKQYMYPAVEETFLIIIFLSK